MRRCFFFPKPGGLGLTSRGGFGFAGPWACFLLVADVGRGKWVRGEIFSAITKPFSTKTPIMVTFEFLFNWVETTTEMNFFEQRFVLT